MCKTSVCRSAPRVDAKSFSRFLVRKPIRGRFALSPASTDLLRLCELDLTEMASRLQAGYSGDRGAAAPYPAALRDRGCARGCAAPAVRHPAACSGTTFLLAAIAACCSIQSPTF